MATNKTTKKSKKQKLNLGKPKNKLALFAVLSLVVISGFFIYQSFAALNIVRAATGGPWTLSTTLKTFNTLKFTPEAWDHSKGKPHMYQICIIGSTGGQSASFYARQPFNSERVWIGKYTQQVCTKATSMGAAVSITPQLQKYSGPNIKMTHVYLVKVR